MEKSQVPQPDLTLRILPEFGGGSGIAGKYSSGAPELIVEVALSSYSRDFGVKKRLYERMEVREYLIAVPREEKLVGLSAGPSGFQPLQPDDKGIFRSACFPGLWLDTKALWAVDLQGMNAVLQQGLATPEHAAFVAHLASQKH
jgi:Uma2 family endonuclease